MAEYIDRKELEERINVFIKPPFRASSEQKELTEWVKDECIRQAHVIPTADVVAVVRCKDCISSRPLNRNDRFEAMYAEGCVYCMRSDDGVSNEHFCGYGERKDNAKR